MSLPVKKLCIYNIYNKCNEPAHEILVLTYPGLNVYILVRLHPDLVENHLSYFTNKPYAVGNQKNHIETVLLINHNKYFNRSIRKLFTVYAKKYAYLGI